MMLGLARLVSEGKGMSDMSPLGKLILIAMLWGVRFAAAAFAAIFALVVWQKWFSAAAADITRQDYAFLVILAALFIAALWFARSVKREL
jgi:hypothetical protein